MEEQVRRYFQGMLDDSERLELLRRMDTDSRLKSEFIGQQNIEALSLLWKQEQDEREARRKYSQLIRSMKEDHLRPRHSFSLYVRYVAAAALLIGSTAFITQHLSKESLPYEKAMSSLYVPSGQRAQLVLPDGTQVWLNTRSTLTYPTSFGSKERRVNLTGEAFFDVAKDAERPFIVSTKDVEMKVLGTKFNVYNYPGTDYIQASLLEGSIEVSDLRMPTRRVRLKPNETVTVCEGKMQVQPTTSPDHFLWKDGIYCFENESLKNILIQLERYYDVKIEVKDPELLTIRYSGKFRQQDGIDEILRIIGKINRFTVTKDMETNTVRVSK